MLLESATFTDTSPPFQFTWRCCTCSVVRRIMGALQHYGAAFRAKVGVPILAWLPPLLDRRPAPGDSGEGPPADATVSDASWVADGEQPPAEEEEVAEGPVRPETAFPIPELSQGCLPAGVGGGHTYDKIRGRAIGVGCTQPLPLCPQNVADIAFSH